MIKVQKILELDVDGVLLDVYTPVELYLSLNGQNFSFAENIKTWGMSECGPVVSKELKKLIVDPELRGQATFYNGAIDFLYEIYKYSKQKNMQLVLNSHEFRRDTAKVKQHIIENMLSTSGLSDIKYNISSGLNKEMLNSYICIDDSIPNIETSKAKYRILYGMFHNTPTYNIIPKGSERIEGYDNILRRVSEIE